MVAPTRYWSHGQEWEPSMRSSYKTKTKQQTLYPKWREKFRFNVPRAGAVLRLEVFDYDTGEFNADDPLGFVEIPLEALLHGKCVQPWVRLRLATTFASELKRLDAVKKPKVELFPKRVPSRNAVGDEGEGEEDWNIDDADLFSGDSTVFAPAMMLENLLVNETDKLVHNVSHVMGGLGKDKHDTKEAKHDAKGEGKRTKKGQMWPKYLGWEQVSARNGEHACVHVSMQYHYAPYGDALTGLLWPEGEYEYVPAKFDIDEMLTEVFKTLRLIDPIIQFFSADDLTGLMNNWYWDRPARSLFWVIFMRTLYTSFPFATWSFFQAYLVFVSYKGYHRRVRQLVQYRLGRALRVLHGIPADNPPGTLPTRVPPSIAREAGYHQPEEEHKEQKVDAKEGKAVGKAADGGGGGGDGSRSFDRGGGGCTGGDDNESIPWVGVPPTPKYMPEVVDQAMHAAKTNPNTVTPVQRLSLITAGVEAALSAPPFEPAFWGRPVKCFVSSEVDKERFDCMVPVHFWEAGNKEYNWNWCPEDDYDDCEFGLKALGPVIKGSIDKLLGLLQAPWMDKTHNLLIKINGILDSLHRLFDWREPAKCKAVAGALTVSAIIHLFVPFTQFLWLLNYFLFIYFTPAWEWGLRVLTLPFKLPGRLKVMRAAVNDALDPPPPPAGSPRSTASTADGSSPIRRGLRKVVKSDAGLSTKSPLSAQSPQSPGSALEMHVGAWPHSFEPHPLLERLLVPDGHSSKIRHKREKALMKEEKKSSQRGKGGSMSNLFASK